MSELPDRFWAKVDKETGPICIRRGRCWLWTGAKASNGYGFIKVQGVMLRSHRFLWECFQGEIPEGLCICHHCDNPACVRLNHLFLGSHLDNARDKHQKGRQRYIPAYNQIRGEKHPSSKLTENQVKEIRQQYVRGSRALGTYGLAEVYGVSQQVIFSIISRKKWKHI